MGNHQDKIALTLHTECRRTMAEADQAISHRVEIKVGFAIVVHLSTTDVLHSRLVPQSARKYHHSLPPL
jgi:hypothetical protein